MKTLIIIAVLVTMSLSMVIHGLTGAIKNINTATQHYNHQLEQASNQDN